MLKKLHNSRVLSTRWSVFSEGAAGQHNATDRPADRARRPGRRRGFARIVRQRHAPRLLSWRPNRRRRRRWMDGKSELASIRLELGIGFDDDDAAAAAAAAASAPPAAPACKPKPLDWAT